MNDNRISKKDTAERENTPEPEKTIEKKEKNRYNGTVTFSERQKSRKLDPWRADTFVAKKKHFLGWFSTKELAEEALAKAERK